MNLYANIVPVKVKRKYSLKIAAIFCISSFVLLQCTGMDPGIIRSIDERWTIGLYMESSLGDINLAQYIEADLEEIRDVEASRNSLRLVALVHKAPQEGSTEAPSVNDITLHEFTFEKDGTPTEAISVGNAALLKLGIPASDTDTAAIPDVWRARIHDKWLAGKEVFDTYLNYVADVYTGKGSLSADQRGSLAFVLWGHGDGARGIFQLDRTRILSNAEVASSFATLKDRDLHIDSIVTDACAMAHIEFAHELATATTKDGKPVADFLASSQELINAAGLDYKYLLGYFLNKYSGTLPGVSRFATAAAQAYGQHYTKESPTRKEVFSVIQLDKVKALAGSFKNFRDDLANYIFSDASEEELRSTEFVNSLFHKKLPNFPEVWPSYSGNTPTFPNPIYLPHNISLSGLGQLYSGDTLASNNAVKKSALELVSAAQEAIVVNWVHPGRLEGGAAKEAFGISVSTFTRKLLKSNDPAPPDGLATSKDRLCKYVSTAAKTDTQKVYTLGTLYTNIIFTNQNSTPEWWQFGSASTPSIQGSLLKQSILNTPSNYCTS